MEDNRTVEEYLSKTAAILDELESKVRRVRTPEGAARYGQPINSIIKPDVVPNVPIKVPHQIAMARADELKPKEKQSPKIGPDWSGSMKKLLEADEGWEYDERVLMGRKIPVLKKGDYIIGKHVAGGFVVRYGSTNRYNITQTLKQAVAIADNDGLKNPRPYQRRPKAPEPRRRRAKKPSGGTPELRGSTLQYNGTKVKIKTNPDGTPYAPSSIQTLMTSLRRAIGHAAWLDELNRGSEGFTSDKEVAAAQKRLSDIVKMSEWFIDKHGSPADRRALRQIQSNGPAPRRRMTY